MILGTVGLAFTLILRISEVIQVYGVLGFCRYCGFYKYLAEITLEANLKLLQPS